MAEYTFWKFRWAYNANDPAVTFVKGPEGTGYYSGYSASGQFRGSYLRAAESATTAPVSQPAAPEPVNQKFAGWGKVIPISMGQRRMSPQIIWLRQPVSIGVTATADFAVSWGYNADDNPDDTVVSALYADATLIWTIADGPLLPGAWSWTYYPGTETQMPDPTMVAANGAENTPAYRNQLVGVFLNFPLEKFGFKLPGISAEIVGSGGEMPRNDSWNPSDKHALVVLEDNFTISKSSPADPVGVDDVAGWTGVRSRTSHRRGQYYFELTLDKQWRGAWYSFGSVQGIGGGVSAPYYPLNQAPGQHENSVGVATTAFPADPDLRLRSGWNRVGGLPAWNEGETVGIHVNMDEGYARARIVPGGAWTAPCYYVSPPHPVSTVDVEVGDPLYVHATVALAPETYLVGYSDRQTINFGASPFKGAIPDGATAWNGDGNTGFMLGMLPLRDFISKISTYCGLVPEIDLNFTGIDDVIHGGLITRDTTFSDFLTVLGRAYGFDFYEGEQIRIVRRVIGSTYVIDKVIPREDLIVEGDRSIQTTRRNDDSPTEIELSYIDRTQQFRWNIQKARRILFPVKTTRSIRKDAFAIPVITTANDALTSAGRALYREAMQNVDHEASMLPRHIAVEPSDILTITAGDTEYTVKVTSISMNADSRLAFTAVNLLTDEDMAWTADAGSPNLPYAGNLYFMETEEGADTFSATQTLPGLLIGTEGADIFAGALIAAIPGDLAAIEGADIFAAIGAPATDPSFASVVLLSGFEGADAAATPIACEATGKTISFFAGGQLDTAQKKFGASSLWTGISSSSYAYLADSNDWDFGSGQFTVEMWVRFDGTNLTNQALVGQWSGAGQAWFFHITGGALTWIHQSSGFPTVGAAWSPTANTWYHVAADRDATNKIRVYVDGTMIASGTPSSSIASSSADLNIGLISGAPTFDLKAWIDELRITKGVARYASDSGYTVPATAFPRS